MFLSEPVKGRNISLRVLAGPSCIVYDEIFPHQTNFSNYYNIRVRLVITLYPLFITQPDRNVNL